MLFNMSMPVTLLLINNTLPKNKCFGFGISACSLMAFTLAANDYYIFLGFNSYVILAVITMSAVLILLSGKIIKKRTFALSLEPKKD